MDKRIKKIASKIHKTGFYKIVDISEKTISYKHFDRVFSFDLRVKTHVPNCGLFRSGYVHEFEVTDLTFESDYKSLGKIKKAFFAPDYEQETDNPDFVLRASLSLIGLDHLNLRK